MTAASSAIGGNANPGTEQLCGKRHGSVRPLAEVMRKLRELYPAKTAANIAARAGVTTRAAEYWIAGERDMSADAFVSLLWSDDGYQILRAVMEAMPEKKRPRWWRRQMNTALLADYEVNKAKLEEQAAQLRMALLK